MSRPLPPAGRAEAAPAPAPRPAFGSGVRVGRRLAAGAVVAVAAVAASVVVAGSGWGRTLDPLVEGAALALRGPGWHLMRGVLSVLVIPGLFVVAALVCVTAGRVSIARAAVVGGQMVGANLTVQALKHPLRALVSGLDPLSGHVGVVTAVVLGWLLVAPAPWRRRTLIPAALVVGAVSAGVVLAGWHTLPQVIAPMGVCVGWAVAAAGLLPGGVQPAPGRGALAVPLAGLGAAALVIGLAAAASTMTPPAAPAALWAVVLAVLGAAAVAVALFSWLLERDGGSLRQFPDPAG